jgi:hypothetical protein
MFAKRISGLATVVTLAAAATPSAAQAQSRDWENGYEVGLNDGYDLGHDDGYVQGHGDGYGHGWSDGYQVDRQDYYQSGYYYRSSYVLDDHEYVDRRPQRVLCRRGEGSGGLVIGALAGGLLGREIARDRTTGAIIAGGIGALAGHALDRGSCR